MTSELIEQMREDLQLFIEAGMIAIKQRDDLTSSKLFFAAKILAEDQSIPDICIGYLSMQNMEMKVASKIFRSVFEKNPKNYLAMSLLGISLSFLPDSSEEGLRLINEAKEKSDNEEAINVCNVALKWIKHDSRFREHKSSHIYKLVE